MADKKLFNFQSGGSRRQVERTGSSQPSQSNRFSDSFDINQPLASAPRTIPKVLSPYGMGRGSRNDGNNVGDSSTLSDEVSIGSFDEYDQGQQAVEERETGGSFEQSESRGRSPQQHTPSRLSSSVPGQKRTRSTISSSSDDGKSDFKPPHQIPTFAADPPQRRGSQQNARPSTGVVTPRNSRARNQSPASLRGSTPGPFSGDDLIQSIVQNSSLLSQHIQQVLNSQRFKIDTATSAKDQLSTELSKIRMELDSKKREVIQVNNHLQAQKRINEIYQADIEGLNAIKEKLLHGIRQTNARLNIQGEKIEDLVVAKETFTKEKEELNADIERRKTAESILTDSLKAEIEKLGGLQIKIGELEATVGLKSEALRSSATMLEEFKKCASQDLAKVQGVCEEEVRQLREKIESLTEEKLEQAQTIAKVVEQLNNSKAELDLKTCNLTQSLDTAVAEKAALLEETAELKDQIKNNLQAISSTLKSSSGDIALKLGQYVELTEKLETLAESKNSMQRQLESEIADANSKLCSVEAEAAAARTANDELQTRLKEVEAALKQQSLDATDEKSRLESEWAEKYRLLDMEKNKLSETIASQTTFTVELQKNFDSISTALKGAGMSASLETSVEQILAAINDSTQKSADENKKLKKHSDNQSQENFHLKASISALEEKLKTEKNFHDTTVRSLKETIEEMRATNDDIKKKLDSHTAVSKVEKQDIIKMLEKIEEDLSSMKGGRDNAQKLNSAPLARDSFSASKSSSMLPINSKSLTKQDSFDEKPVLKAKVPIKSDFVSSDEIPTSRKINPRGNSRPKVPRKTAVSKSKAERNDSLDLFDAPY